MGLWVSTFMVVGNTNNRKEPTMTQSETIIVSPADRFFAHDTLANIRREIAIRLNDGGEYPQDLVDEANLIDKAIYAESFPKGYSSAVVEASRMFLVINRNAELGDYDDALRFLAEAVAS